MEQALDNQADPKKLSLLFTFALTLSFLLLLKTCKRPGEEEEKAPFKLKKDYSAILLSGGSGSFESKSFKRVNSQDIPTDIPEKEAPLSKSSFVPFH